MKLFYLFFPLLIITACTNKATSVLLPNEFVKHTQNSTIEDIIQEGYHFYGEIESKVKKNEIMVSFNDSERQYIIYFNSSEEWTNSTIHTFFSDLPKEFQQDCLKTGIAFTQNDSCAIYQNGSNVLFSIQEPLNNKKHMFNSLGFYLGSK